MPTLKHLTHYPEPLQAQVCALIAANRLGEALNKRYREPHMVSTDRALQEYVLSFKAQHMKSAVTPSTV